MQGDSTCPDCGQKIEGSHFCPARRSSSWSSQRAEPSGGQSWPAASPGAQGPWSSGGESGDTAHGSAYRPPPAYRPPTPDSGPPAAGPPPAGSTPTPGATPPYGPTQGYGPQGQGASQGYGPAPSYGQPSSPYGPTQAAPGSQPPGYGPTQPYGPPSGYPTQPPSVGPTQVPPGPVARGYGPPPPSAGQPPDGQAAQPAGGRNNNLIWIGVILLMVSVAVAAAVGINRLRAPSAPAAVVDSSPAASATTRPTASPRTSPRPSPSVPATTGSPPARPSPTSRATPQPTDAGPLPDHPAEAFRERLRRGQASYRMTVSGSVAFGNEERSVDHSFDVSGADYAGTVKIGQSRVRVTTDVIVKDGIGYERVPGGEWMRLSEAPEPLPGDLFGSLGPTDWQALQYVGPETREGRELHLLRIPSLDWERLSGGLLEPGAVGMAVRTLEFNLWVTEDGRPRAAVIAFDGTYSESGVEVDLTYRLDYTFTDFGEPIEIEAPERFSDPDSPTS